MKTNFVLPFVVMSILLSCLPYTIAAVEIPKIKLIIDNKEFTATMNDNEAAQTFVSLLPMTISMTEMGNNEKYYYLTQSLPGTAVNPGVIQTGDIMCWSANCLVLFYKTFSTSYSYIELGRVDDITGFAQALGTGNVRVTIEVENLDPDIPLNIESVTFKDKRSINAVVYNKIDKDINGSLIVGIYEGNKLIELKITDKDFSKVQQAIDVNFNTEINTNFHTIKVFIWSTTDKLQPLANAYKM